MNNSIACLICLIMCIITIVVIDRLINKPEKLSMTYNDVINRVKTGDIVLFRHKKMHPATKVLLGDRYGHSGMIYEKDGIKYVIEAVGDDDYSALGKMDNAGVNLVPLRARFMSYNGQIAIKFLNKKLDVARKKKLDELINSEYKKINFNYVPDNYVKSCVLMLPNKDNNTKSVNMSLNCGMMTAKILTDLNLIKLKINEACIRPICYTKIYKYADMIDGYKYDDELYEIKF
jgi:hypothetical protein